MLMHSPAPAYPRQCQVLRFCTARGAESDCKTMITARIGVLTCMLPLAQPFSPLLSSLAAPLPGLLSCHWLLSCWCIFLSLALQRVLN